MEMNEENSSQQLGTEGMPASEENDLSVGKSEESFDDIDDGDDDDDDENDIDKMLSELQNFQEVRLVEKWTILTITI